MGKRKSKSVAGTSPRPRKRAKETKEAQGKPADASRCTEKTNADRVDMGAGPSPTSQTYQYPEPTTWERSYQYHYLDEFSVANNNAAEEHPNTATAQGNEPTEVQEEHKAPVDDESASVREYSFEEIQALAKLDRDDFIDPALLTLNPHEEQNASSAKAAPRKIAKPTNAERLTVDAGSSCTCQTYMYPEPKTWEGSYDYHYLHEFGMATKGATEDTAGPTLVQSIKSPENQEEENKEPVDSKSAFVRSYDVHQVHAMANVG
ncbi:hypothetical protein HDK64DRAFT_307818 [Phyllosticta capitalensis]